MTPGPFTPPPNLEELTREQLLETIRVLVDSLNKYAAASQQTNETVARISARLDAQGGKR